MDDKLDYYSTRLLKADIAGIPIPYYSKPGLADWDIITPSITLLATHARPLPHDRVWCLNCGPGALAVAMANMAPYGTCMVSDYDALAITSLQQTQTEYHIHNIHIITESPLLPPQIEPPDLVLLNIHKGRNLNRRSILQAWLSLRPGGRLLIAGANDQGIQSVIKDAAQWFQNFSLLAYKKGCRVAQFVRSAPQPGNPPDWAAQPGIAPGTWHEFQICLDERVHNFVSLPGVFSSTELDLGSLLLISSLKDLSGKKVLDVGCGYGVLGYYAALSGATKVDLVDSHLLAVVSTQENIARNRITNCQVFWSDLLAAVSGNSYDLIISNPPFHAGIQVDYLASRALITSAISALAVGGVLRIVANRFLPYDRLMGEVFGNVKIEAQNSAYRILVSRKETV